MKYFRTADLLFFISFVCLHCLPSYCDSHQDASLPPDSIQGHQPVSSGAGRAEDVPSQQNQAEKTNLGLENSLKESVQPNVEYVNSKVDEKDAQQIADGIGSAESLHKATENIKSIHASLKSSIQMKEPDLQAVDMPADIKHVKSIKSSQTEPLLDALQFPTNGEQAPDHPTHFPTVEIPSNLRASSVLHLTSESVKLVEENAHQQYDGMPSFDEWKKMMLAEQQRGGQKVPSPLPGKKISSQKRRRNYSSYECGAKIVSSNGEAEGTSRILNELVDEYMLNPCKAKIWFVIELCESVQASQIELANFELFSSCPKDFVVSSSDNFPTRDWVPLGTFTAAEQRVLQSFELKQEGFGKFIKIELLSYYGEEHYCPLSVVRIFGTSMVDEYEEMETLASHPDIPDDDLDRLDIPIEDTKSTNIFGSATDAVMNIVKKAAQALGQQSADDKKSNETADSQNNSEIKICNEVDSSTQQCKDIPASSSLHSLLLSPSSMHQPMFRLLHRCDQCVSPSVRYYSSAQPHCRFFQATLGPVVFQTICDWFREHPLAIAHESPAPGKKEIPGESFIVSPTKSPPPQIMRIPLERDITLSKILNETLSQPDNSVTVNIASSSLVANKSASVPNKIVLQSSINPTQTYQRGHSSMLNNSKLSETATSKESIIPSDHSIQDIVIKASVSIPEKTDGVLKDTLSETSVLSDGEYPASSDLVTESEEQQFKELFSDPILVASDLSNEIVPATDLPNGFKSGEEKVGDIRSDSSGRFEPTAGTAAQKESVFMRMSNRIKALESNMSLSSLYLQELSQRYRRQMDDMQRAFNRTIGTLNDTARKAAEKDIKQQEVLNSLQLQVANLTETLELLLSERSHVFRQMVETHVCLMLIEAIIMITIMSLCIRRITTTAKQSSSVERTPMIVSPSRLSKRRNSADSCSPPIARKVKKRSNSEETLNAEVLIVEPLPVLLDPILKAKKKNKKRNKGIHRSVSHPAVQKSGTTNFCPGSHHTHSEGCMLVKSMPHRLGHACENCDNNVCTQVKVSPKERRENCLPLQNLTNGSIVSMTHERNLKSREKFSIKKFLKFQKRDSI